MGQALKHLPTAPADHNHDEIPICHLIRRKQAYRERLSISDPTIWRWTRAGKLSPPVAVINGREYSTPETVEADVQRLIQSIGN